MFKKLIILAFLLVLIPCFAEAAIPVGAVWEVRTTGSNTNGGGWVAGSSGTDYSQQNAAQYSLTNGVTNGTTTIATVSASTDMVGNIAYIAGGTGSVIAGWYYITAVSAGVSLTVDRSTGLTAGTGVTINIGGALATPAAVAAIAVSGNKVFIKAGGTYTTTANISFAQSASSAIPFQIIGYSSNRTDNGRATIQAQTTTGLTVLTLAGSVVRNIIIDCNSLATCTGVSITSSSSFLWNNTIKNYTTAGINSSLGNGQNTTIINNEITGGTSSSGVGINILASSGSVNAIILGNYVHDGAGTGIFCSAYCSVIQNVIANQTGAASNGIDFSTGTGLAISNTIYNVGEDGISANFINNTVLNNILANNGRYGVNNTTNFSSVAPAQPKFDGNAYYSNATAARHNIDDTTTSSSNSDGINPYTNVNDVTLSSTPFVNAGGGNFSLNSTGGGGGAARQAGLPKGYVGITISTSYPDFGSFQAQATGATGGAYSFGQ